MIAIDYQSVAIVDSKGFRGLTSSLEPRYQLPSIKYVSETVIPTRDIVEKMKGKTQLREGAKQLNFTTDVWSSDVNSNVLLGFTAH